MITSLKGAEKSGKGCLSGKVAASTLNLDLKRKIHIPGFPFKPLGFYSDSHPAQGRQGFPGR